MAPSVTCRFHWLNWIGSHRKVRCIARPHGMVGGDLLDRLAATDRLHGDSGLELGTVVRRLLNSFGEDCAYGGSPHSWAVPRLRG
jgi:hypothetical protein